MERTKFEPMNFSSILFGFENPPPFNYQRMTHTPTYQKNKTKRKLNQITQK
jgi:hypothetical protein